MIGRLTGILLEKNPPQVLLDVHGVGYEVDVQVKLGPGGLRDVEFTVQLLQLVHGRTGVAVCLKEATAQLEQTQQDRGAPDDDAFEGVDRALLIFGGAADPGRVQPPRLRATRRRHQTHRPA